MRKLIKWIGIVVAVLVALVGGVLVWVLATWAKDYSSMPKPAITASSDPIVIAHGEYLFNAVGHCSSCHGGPASSSRKRGDRFPPDGGYVFEAGTVRPLRRPQPDRRPGDRSRRAERRRDRPGDPQRRRP